MRAVSKSRLNTQALAKKVLKSALRRRGPVVLALWGELGSGKTTFVQGVARALGIREKIQSPTFVLMKWYRIPKSARPFRPFHHLIHVDAYRIESLREARHIGLKEVLRDRDAIVVIEWADQVRKLVPPHATWVAFKHGAHQDSRVLEIKKQKAKIKTTYQKPKTF